MADRSTPSKSTVQAVGSDLKALVMDVIIASAKAAAMTEAPWLAWPVFSQLFEALLRWMGTLFFQAVAEWSTIESVDVQTWIEKKDYQTALTNLKLAHDEALQKLKQAGKAGDSNAILTAKQNFKKAFQSLVHWDGSSLSSEFLHSCSDSQS
jgi:hypothetical protein